MSVKIYIYCITSATINSAYVYDVYILINDISNC